MPHVEGFAATRKPFSAVPGRPLQRHHVQFACGSLGQSYQPNGPDGLSSGIAHLGFADGIGHGRSAAAKGALYVPDSAVARGLVLDFGIELGAH